MIVKKKQSRVDYTKLNASKRFCNSTVVREVAEDLNVEESLVAKIAESQSKLTVRTIKGGGLENIIYVYIGKLKVNTRQIQIMMANAMQK